jgi:hypothetical protein
LYQKSRRDDNEKNDLFADWERFPFVGEVNGNNHSFALKGQHKPARRNAAGNSQHAQRPERAVD